MNTKPLISVIVTTYNSEKYIERTLNSIVQQNGINELFTIELIVADDCSTDTTLTIVKKYNAVNIVSTAKNSGGPNKGRNLGLKEVSGDYICIVDHDDQWKPNRIKAVLPYLNKASIITSGYTVIDEDSKKQTERIQNSTKNYLVFKKNATFLQKLTKSLKGQNTYLGSLIYSKDLKNILFEEHFGMIDFDWVLRLFHQQKSIEVCSSLYNRYVFGENLSLNENYRRKDFYFSLFFIEQYENQYPKEVKIAYKKIHGSRARYYYVINNMKKARFYFLKSPLNLKTFAYYLTTFIGASYVKKKFNIFG